MMAGMALFRGSCWVLFALSFTGCETAVKLHRAEDQHAFQQVTSNVLSDGALSAGTANVLRSFELMEPFEKDPVEALKGLHQEARVHPDRDVYLALAEASFAAAKRRPETDYDLYLSSAAYAWILVFPLNGVSGSDPFDPSFRFACDLYNRALGRALTDDRGEVTLTGRTAKTLLGEMTIEVSWKDFAFPQGEFDRFLNAGEFEVVGLKHRHRKPGLGIPLVAIGDPKSSPPSLLEQLEPANIITLNLLFGSESKFSSRTRSLPATAFLRFDGDLLEGRPLRAMLDVSSATRENLAQIGERAVPLEQDLTAPVAYALETSNEIDLELPTFFGSDTSSETGLMMPLYEPGKIPVVFVHGTASSAARWAEMVNDLMSDDEIRSRFQFWFFKYRSGQPILFSANELRKSLREAVARLDPTGSSAELRNIVLIGHSQGGLLCRLAITDPGTLLWDELATTPFAEVEADPETKALLKDVILFEPLPCVSRAVFIATPHRGTFLAGWFLVRFVKSLVRLPATLGDTAIRLVTSESSRIFRVTTGKTLTSIDNMSPKNPFLIALDKLPRVSDTAFHSIIAIDGSENPPEGDDGVVEYTSAHLEGAQSERIVRSGHSCQSDPVTIQEVKRILRIHSVEFTQKTTPARVSNR